MRTLRRILLGLVALIVVLFAVAYIDGLTLPLNHVATVTGTISAPPAKVLYSSFAGAPLLPFERYFTATPPIPEAS